MPREPIPEELRRFILTSVPSVPFVEAMIALRDARGAPLDTPSLARRLYLPEHAAAGVVEQLVAAGIAEPAGGGHRFAPREELAAMLEILVAHYRSHLVEVTDVIHSKTGRMARQFADAFKWRKET